MLWTSTVVAALGSFLFGFDTAVISGTDTSLRHVFGLSDNLWGFTVSIALIGTMFGSLLVGRPADWWGRRKVLAGLAVMFLVSAVGCALAWNWHALLCLPLSGRAGHRRRASVASPMYITEIAPANRRGVLTATSQLNIVVGILISYLSNYVVAWYLGPDHPDVWRWMLGVMIVPSVAFFVTVLLIPESPRWLVRQGRESEATGVLTRFGHADPLRETAEIVESLREERRVGHQHLFQRKYLRPLLLACMIAAFGQFDGINAVIYYSPRIFQHGRLRRGRLAEANGHGRSDQFAHDLCGNGFDRPGGPQGPVDGRLRHFRHLPLAGGLGLLYRDPGLAGDGGLDGHYRQSCLLGRRRCAGPASTSFSPTPCGPPAPRWRVA